MDKFRPGWKRKICLLLSLTTNLGLLFTFKYFNFFNEALRQFSSWFDLSYRLPALNVLLPVGISFYTFQTLSYTIEVYLGRQKPERHLGIFALYVAYFPQLVAGPIERPQNLLPQLKTKADFDYTRVVEGLRLILWGMFKKVVIADRLALVVDSVYNKPGEFSGPALTIATVFFGFQIYCDFSGYSDIAIGTARVMGHKLMQNFNHPYAANSISDFWKRWHISLSTWFKDYLYIPLGGSRVRTLRFSLNIMIIFVISGLWHGANWTFLLWGAIHGMYYLTSWATRNIRCRAAQAVHWERFPRLHNFFRVIITFSLVSFAWIIFRANSISDAWLIITRLASGWQNTFSIASLNQLIDSFGIDLEDIWIGIACIGILSFMQSKGIESRISQILGQWDMPARWAFYLGLLMLIMNVGVAQEIPFIYFQF
jgi:D-alanyl-lipoteichoic acid acyltransferase DltB (MBOAT superfamily)